MNLYSYCHNNPLKYIDPSGNTAEVVLVEEMGGDYLDYGTVEVSTWWDDSKFLIETFTPVGDIVDGYRFIFDNEMTTEERMIVGACILSPINGKAGKELIQNGDELAEGLIRAAEAGAVRTLDTGKLFEDCYWHIFSDKHIKGGIMDLGSSEGEIMNSRIDIVKEIDGKGMLRVGPTQIKTTINGYEAEVRVFIKDDGEVINFDMFKGWSPRNMGNTIYYNR